MCAAKRPAIATKIAILFATGLSVQTAVAGLNTPDYLAAAAAAERCTGHRLTLVEEMRLAQLLRREGFGQISMLDVSDNLAKARDLAPVACESAVIQEQVQFFTQSVLPQLQKPRDGL